MTTYMFPGQGSQSVGMGQGLFDEFSDIVAQANDILGYDLPTLCLKDPDQKLNQTNYTQPALYVVNVLSYLKKVRDGGAKADYVIGHSLGEYDALFAARVFDFETGLKLVQKRGELMSQATGGGMAAIVGLSQEAIKAVIEQNNLTQISIANVNSATQIVISGAKDAVGASESFFVKAGATMVVPLKVSGAFHSPFMDAAAKEFSAFMQQFKFSPPVIPVIANVTALPYEDGRIMTTLDEQINHPVLWLQTMRYLMAQGETVFEEVGPGKVLAGLAKRIEKGQ